MQKNGIHTNTDFAWWKEVVKFRRHRSSSSAAAIAIYEQCRKKKTNSSRHVNKWKHAGFIAGGCRIKNQATENQLISLYNNIIIFDSFGSTFSPYSQQKKNPFHYYWTKEKEYSWRCQVNGRIVKIFWTRIHSMEIAHSKQNRKENSWFVCIIRTCSIKKNNRFILAQNVYIAK